MAQIEQYTVNFWVEACLCTITDVNANLCGSRIENQTQVLPFAK